MHSHTPTTNQPTLIKPLPRADWQVIVPLMALTLVPMLAGTARLVGLANGASIAPENARFASAPLPVVIHILSATLFCLLGALQFAPGFRCRRPGWHRMSGRFLMVAGLAAALSGLWMTQFYAIPPRLQGDLLHTVRYLVGAGMAACVALSWIKIMHRDIAAHRAWMIRGYAIGQGAGTQVLIMLPWAMALGEPTGLLRDVLMSAAWVLNLAVAEWIIQKPSANRPQLRRLEA